MKGKVLILTMLGLSIAPAGARTWNVPSEAPTIQAGVDSAAAGDTVLLAPGTYAGPGNRDIDFGGVDLVLLSKDGPEATIIDCEEAGRGLHFHNDEGPQAMVAGFTIRRGSADFGGAIYARAASPTIQDCILTENSATELGGGWASVLGSQAALRGCRIEENSCQGPGAGIACYNSYLTIEDCTVRANTAGGDGGGILCVASSDPIIRDCDIEENSADRGGGIACDAASGAIENCRLRFNDAGSGGGLECLNGADPVLTECDLSANTAGGGGGVGCLYGGAPSFIACRLSGNEAGSGAGINCLSESVVHFDHCTL
ncbi:MAG: hypothetical protein GF355_05790, partial [Candidatus Eisenbacteria bacterium]|nr:hypothetical protein [Candidatus Eisenbacteria bacterium]